MKTAAVIFSLFVAASCVDEDFDFKCFQNKTHVMTNSNSDTFEIRIEHGGALAADWFDSGVTLDVGKDAVKYNTTAKAMEELCKVLPENKYCSDALADIGKIPRFLTVAYDGESVYGGMATMDITIAQDGKVTHKWGECIFMNQTAAKDMEKFTFTYTKWDTSAIPDFTGSIREDKLYVSQAAPVLTSWTTVVALLVMAKIV